MLEQLCPRRLVHALHPQLLLYCKRRILSSSLSKRQSHFYRKSSSSISHPKIDLRAKVITLIDYEKQDHIN